jgi:uncharacterized protein with beta-barrel porin domain
MRAHLLTTTAVMALLAAMPAQAQDANWRLTPVSGDFNTAGNWSPAAVPTGTGNTLTPLFQALPGATFIVNGAFPAKDAALASAGGELRRANRVTLLAKFDGEFASHSTTYAGTGTFRYRW